MNLTTGRCKNSTTNNQQTNQTTAENWNAALRYEKVLTPKWFNMFVSHGWRGDRFQGVREGHDTDIGAKYFTANSKEFVQFFELGYRYTRELLLAAPAPENRVGVGNFFKYKLLEGVRNFENVVKLHKT